MPENSLIPETKDWKGDLAELRSGVDEINVEALRFAFELAGKRLDNLYAASDIVTNKGQWITGVLVVAAAPLITMAAKSAKENCYWMLLGYGLVLACMVVAFLFGWKLFKARPYSSSGARPENMALGYYLKMGHEQQEKELLLAYMNSYKGRIDKAGELNRDFANWLRLSFEWSIAAVILFGVTFAVESLLFP